MVAFALLPMLPPSDTGAVVDRVRRDYAGYAEARAMYAPETWTRLEREARTGEIPVRRFLAALLDPDVSYYAPPPPSTMPRRIDFGSGRGLLFALVVAEQDRLVDMPKPNAPYVGPKFNPVQFATFPTVVIDLRSTYTGATPPDATLGLMGVAGEFRDSGSEFLSTPTNLAAWRATPEAFPGGPASLNRAARAKPGTWVSLTPDRTVRVEARSGPERIAILVSSGTGAPAGRWVELARRSPRVRVFGTPSHPLGLRGVRRFAVGTGEWLSLPTFRRRGSAWVLPDEDASTLPPQLWNVRADLVRYRADQWCRLGE